MALATSVVVTVVVAATSYYGLACSSAQQLRTAAVAADCDCGLR